MAIDTNTQKARLEELLADVVAELQTLGIKNPHVKEDWIATPDETVDAEADPNVAADRVEAWEERRATLSVLETRFNNINRALKKIEDGTYGVCEISGEPIDEDRLAAYPAARTTLEHADREAELAP